MVVGLEIEYFAEHMHVMDNIKAFFAIRTPGLYRIAKRIALALQSFVTKSSPQEIIFTEIYRKGGWGGGESRSGRGSTLDHTVNVRIHLPKILREYDISVLLDIPCGDFHWMQEVDLGLTRYIGADIVKKLVEEDCRGYASEQREFLHLDLLSDPLPASDAILCRDCLPHLPLSDIVRALCNIKRSGAKYLITSDYPSCTVNKDIPMGKFRPINFRNPPFLFPSPLLRVDDFDGLLADKSPGMWRISDIPLDVGDE